MLVTSRLRQTSYFPFLYYSTQLAHQCSITANPDRIRWIWRSICHDNDLYLNMHYVPDIHLSRGKCITSCCLCNISGSNRNSVIKQIPPPPHIHEQTQYLIPQVSEFHDDVIKLKHLPRCWPFVWGIHRSPLNSPHKGQWRGTLMFSLICVWING